MNSLLTIFELLHIYILLKTYFCHTWRISDWITDENFHLENDNKAFSRTVSNGSMRSKNCFVHQKPSLLYKNLQLRVYTSVQVILFEIDCTIFYTNLHELFCEFISWTNWVNSGKFMDNCWISCQVMADEKKVYKDLIIINL